MLHFNLHLVDLFMEGGNIVLSRKDITLEFLDFVIKHELKLFKLLSLFLELDDTSIFVFNGGSSGLELGFLGQNRVLMFDNGLVEDARCASLFFDIFVKIVALGVGGTELASLFLKVSLIVHSVCNNLVEFLLIAILQVINLNPSFIFNFLSALLIDICKVLNHLRFLLVLIVLLQFLEMVLLLHFSFRLVILEE